MELNSLDVLVLLKLQVLDTNQWTQASLSHELCVASSLVNASLKRTAAAQLFLPRWRRVSRQALAEFLIHGVKYVYPPDRGALTRGIVTSYAALPLSDLIVQPDTPPPVWPYTEGTHRGYEFSPVDKRAPKAALQDPKLYEMLVLVDAIRDGRPREANLAVSILNERLGQKS